MRCIAPYIAAGTKRWRRKKGRVVAMRLNEFRDEARRFLVAIGKEEQGAAEIVSMLEGEFAELQRVVGDGEEAGHQIYDLLFLLFELAGQVGCDLDLEWRNGRERKRAKYL